jgi:hypothetical protein
VYVDGFNLYNRRLRYRPQFKWLNLKTLADIILAPPMVVTRVNYYTARISGKLDRDAPKRQQAYLDALATVPEIAIHYGKFMYSKKWAALVLPAEAKPDTYSWPSTLPELVRVQKAEEKGSDVNLGCHLVRDALTNAFDVAVVLTNDTDLVEPMRIAIHEASKRVGLLSPIIKRRTSAGKWDAAHPSLTSVASFTVYIHNSHLASAQFPADRIGSAMKPSSWV